MIKPKSVHHLALSTGDMKAQLKFFTEVLGMELQALFWMHGVEGAWHSFLKLNDQSFLSFVYMPGVAAVRSELGLSHAPHAGGVSAAGTMQHLSLGVDDEDALLTMRDRIRMHGVPVFGELDHGMCKSIYFAGPEGLNLEIACPGPLDPEAWIDPDVVAVAGISVEELALMKNPPPYHRPATPVTQPPYDPTKPHLRYPESVYAKMLVTSDRNMTERLSVPDPPVKRSV